MKYEWCLFLCIIGHGLSSCVKIKFHSMCVWYIQYMIWHEIIPWMVYELTHVGKPDIWINDQIERNAGFEYFWSSDKVISDSFGYTYLIKWQVKSDKW